jgi:hypothetical protein
MVWGIMNPGIGDYGPDGDFPGWEERLGLYFDEHLPPEQKALFGRGGGRSPQSEYISYVRNKFSMFPGDKYMHMFVSPIEQHEVPSVFQMPKSYILASLITLKNGYWAVDEELKAIIERLEPGVHQFFHVPFMAPRGKPYPKSYYIMLVAHRFNSFSPEDSKEGSYEFDGEYYRPFLFRLEHIPELTFKRSVFGRAHVWKETKLLTKPKLFISDELQAECKKAGLRLPRNYKMREV